MTPKTFESSNFLLFSSTINDLIETDWNDTCIWNAGIKDTPEDKYFAVENKITILIACPSGPTIQTVSVKKHLELSDSIWILRGLSQIFSDTS
jgi:hypothetical protein